jgi:hypothetical protein
MKSLVPERIPFEVATVISALKKYESVGRDQILAGLINAGGDTWFEINKLINLFGVRKNCLSSGWSLLLYEFTRTAIKKTVIIKEYHYCQFHMQFSTVFSLKVRSIC